MTRWLIVGGGTAGCIVAARLSEDEHRSVTLLEAGPDHGASPCPGDVGPYFDDPARVVVEHVIRRPGADVVDYRQGRGLGGSSLINGSIVVPGDDPHGAPPHLLPLESPWADGAVGRTMLATDPSASRIRLVRRDRRRITTADAYLRPVSARPNLAVRTGASVARLVVDGRRVVGVELEDGIEVTADRVVLCAGAIRTPTLLLRSGIDTPRVGEGLQDHPAVTFTLTLRPEAIDPAAPSIAVVARHRHHQVVALNHLPAHPELGALMVGLMTVRSTGRVRLAPGTERSTADPVVELAQLTDPMDLDRLCEAAQATADLLQRPAWNEVTVACSIDDRGTPLDVLLDDRARVRAWVLGHLDGHHHVAGTCREGVVTDGGVVRGYERLLVCDASLLPGVPSVNPYLTVAALAERTVAGWRASDPER